MQTFTLNETRKIALPNKPSILKKFDALDAGESFVVRNNHSMEILIYQLINDLGNTFSWEYVEKGPGTWRVKITKLANEKHSPRIGSLAVDDYRKAELFYKFGIDYCCNGNKSLQQAFEEWGLSEEIWNEWYIEALQYKDKEIHRFKNWEVTLLVDYIINTHHTYIRNNSDLIERLSYKVSARHGFAYPELKELNKRLTFFLKDLNRHIDSEEREIFPYIKKLELRHKHNREMTALETKKINSFNRNMIEEHRLLGEEIKHYRIITQNYKLPTDACATFTHFYAKLLEFESDLTQHIHQENNILLPKLI